MTRLPLASRREVQPYSAGFVDALQSYCEQISSAARQNKHHDHRRNLLINFLRVGLALDPVEFELEHKIKAHSVRGRIDAFFRELIIEIKTDLGRERQDAERELKKYFESQPTPDDFVGLVTDGISFEVYIYEAENVQQIGTFVLQADDPGGAFRCLDQLFFTAKRLPPTPEDIVERFGLHSATFNATRRSLLGAFSSVEDDSAVRVKFKEWNGLLAKVYGSEVGDEGLFITHTYLALLSRAIVTLALFAKDKRSNEMYRGLVDGAFFRKRRLNNLAEPDFFSWALDTPAESILIEIIGKLFTCLEVYDFRHLQGDILKELYQGLVDPQSRHDLGEYYTPDWLAELTLETIGYRGGRLLDPACGSGSFLYAAARRLRDETRLTSGMLVQVALESLIGIDVHPVAVLMTKANLLLSLREEIPSFYGEINLQVYMADTLMTGEDSKKRSLSVPVSEKQEVFHIPFSTVERGVKFLDPLIDKLCEFSERGSSSEEKENVAFSGWKAQLVKAELSENEEFLWQSNFRLLVKLEREKRNTVWAYILKNAYRPSYLRHDKVDYIVGNPPWLAYGYIQNEAYKKRVKELTFEHGILDAKDRKVFTRMDTSTLFFAHCSRDFLKDNGTIAFVMPKAAVLPAKQHLKFQRIGFSKILDFAAVKPLFNVPSCVLIRDLAAVNSDIPTTAYAADLHTKRNLSLLSV
jgi:methylase of polypeptide subunit release factors